MNERDASEAVERLAEDQLRIYRQQPKELISHANREASAIDGYRGRQLLELLQNADDAAKPGTSARLLIEIRDDCVVVANSGSAFSLDGLESLVINDCSPKQLDRNRYIGCKGLGFRSVLTWSDCPLISSGHLSVAFDRARALGLIEHLGKNSDANQQLFSEFEAAQGHAPVPIMRFPSVPPATEMGIAHEYRDRGFDTVLVLRIPGDERGDGVRQDVLEQLDTFQTESLLFCRALTEIELRGTVARRWEILREELDNSRTQLIMQTSEGDALWTLHRREGRIEPSGGGHAQKPRDFETAVAVPNEPKPGPDRCLCVFFPTQDALPLPVVLHATLELSDDRNRVHDTNDNRLVLDALATHLADVVAAEADTDHPKRALRMLEGINLADPELKRLGFVERAVSELRDRAIFPRIDGTLGPASNAYRTPHDSWHPLIRPEHFPDVLDIRSNERLSDVLGLFEIGWFESEELVRRLRLQLEEMNPTDSGEFVGRLLAKERLGRFPLGSFILTAANVLLGPAAQCFFTPSAASFPVPGWAPDIQFVHPEFQQGLQETAGRSSLRRLADRLESREAKVDEYRLDTVVRALAARARSGSESEHASRTKELLQWLYKTTNGEPGALASVTVPVLDTLGQVCSPTDCYLGPDYPGGDLLQRLYAGTDGSRFCASRQELALENTNPDQARRFLVALGVHDRPKNVALTDSQSRDLAKRALEQHKYPGTVRDRECDDLAAAMRLCSSRSVKGSELPEHFEDLLSQTDATALVSFFLGDGQSLIARDLDPNGRFEARTANERKMHPDSAVRVPNPVILALRSTAWVPTRDGKRCTPGQVVLSSAASKVLRGLYFLHAIEVEDPLIQQSGGRRAVSGLLTRLGAISSLEAIDTDSLYELLTRLPDDDPDGQHSPGIYRTLLEANVTSEDSVAKRLFLKKGRVWSRYLGESAYRPVADVRYNANVTVPSVIEQHIKVAELPRRKSTKLVRDLLGIEPLAARDIQIELVHGETEYAPSSEDANAAFKRALPYIYAIRLGKKIDEDNRERNLLLKAELRLCTRIRAEATLPKGAAQTIELKSQGERLLLDRTLYVVDHFDRHAASSVRFWQGVATLVAELLGTDVAAESANVFRCRTPAEREDVVRGLVDSDPDEKLSQARERFSTNIEEEESDPKPLPPPKSEDPRDDSSQEADEDIHGVAPPYSDESGVGEARPIGGQVEFVPVEAPTRASGSRRKLVITRDASESRTTRRGPLATEVVTFEIVEEYERLEGRFPVRVSHIHGYEGFGCDLISLDSDSARAQAVAKGDVSESNILRYIEVKGRSSRSGEVELTDNEFKKAESERERYFLYRVFCDPDETTRFELGILEDPTHSDAVRQITRFDLSEGSGANWYEMVVADENRST